jgi:GDP-fucose transporter C1
MSGSSSSGSNSKLFGLMDRPSATAVGDGKDVSQTFKVAAVVAFYFVTSMAVVFLNKLILSYGEYKFPYPLFVSWFQMLVALVCIIICGELSKSVIPSFTLIPPYEFNMDVARRVAPLTSIFCAMILFNNLCLQYVEVSFYQVARSLTIVFNIGFTYSILGKSTSPNAMKACGVVILGYFLGSAGEVRFSWIGVMFGLMSSAFVALYSIYVRRTMDVLDNNEGRLMIYNTTLACVFLFPFVLFSGELDQIRNVHFLGSMTFWGLMTITAVAGFLINIATFLQIKVTSPLTSTISATAKACVQTVISVPLFGNPISFLNALGTFISIAGSALYAYVRHVESQPQK